MLTLRCASLSLLSLSGDDAAWIMERMLYRTPDETCRPVQLLNGSFITPDSGSSCVGASGRRRLFVNPRRVSLLTEHASVSPSGNGVHLQTSTAHINTYAVSDVTCMMMLAGEALQDVMSKGTHWITSYAPQIRQPI